MPEASWKYGKKSHFLLGFEVFNWSAAAIASTALCDAGLVSEQDRPHVIDRSKVWGESKRLRLDLTEKLTDTLSVLFFDASKNKTHILESKEEKLHPRIVPENLYSLVQQLGLKCIGHKTDVKWRVSG